MSAPTFKPGQVAPRTESIVTVIGGIRNDNMSTNLSANTNLAATPFATDAGGRMIMSMDYNLQAVASSGLLKREDDAFANNHAGVFSLAVRNDDQATVTTSTNGDYSQFSVDSKGALFVNTQPGLIKRAFANVAAGTTDSVIVAAVPTKKIRVLAAMTKCAGTATTITFLSKPDAGVGVAISPLFANGVNGGTDFAFMQAGWFETVAGESLTVTTGAGTATGVMVLYIEV